METVRVTGIGSSAMRRILTAACVALLCVGCGAAAKRVTPPPAPAPRCDLAVLWHGARYTGQRPAEPPVPGHMLGLGGVPSCPDVSGARAERAARCVISRSSGSIRAAPSPSTGTTSTSTSPGDRRLARHGGILLDVDGVLHVSGAPIAGAAEAVEQLRENGHRLRFVTNNTTHSRGGWPSRSAASA
jgi:hypothetical protein